ncbi:MAG: GNAT family N-acetyltransferase [Syntrophaceticus sp.]|nr:GNAT family N-acetyltransferase [Syntrophaceticus sp.]
MSEIRFAKKGEIARQKEIWKLCFGDSDQYIDFYYANRYKEDETLLLLQEGEIVSMLTILPIRVNTSTGQGLNSTMLYAIATHPKHQHRGYASQLIESACCHLNQKNNVFSVLVPAGKNLFDYYRHQGFQDGFFIHEISFDWKRLELLPIVENNCTIKSISPQEYNMRRENQLSGKFYVSYTAEDIDYQRKLSQQSGADIYGIEIEGVQGCAVIELLDQGKVFIKELLIADHLLSTAVRHIARLLPSREYILRTPSFLGRQLEGSIRPFGMIRANQGIPPEITPEVFGYLGLAFD